MWAGERVEGDRQEMLGCWVQFGVWAGELEALVGGSEGCEHRLSWLDSGPWEAMATCVSLKGYLS